MPRRAGARVGRTRAAPDQGIGIEVEIARPHERAPADRHLSETVCVGSERLEDGSPQERAQVPLDHVTVGQREPDSVVRGGFDLADAKHFAMHLT